MNHEQQGEQQDHEDKPEAGFDLDIKIPFISARIWGGKEQLLVVWPWLRWIAIGAAAVWGIKEIAEVLR